MTEPIFFKRVDGLTAGDIATLTGATLSDPSRADHVRSQCRADRSGRVRAI